MNRIVFTAAIAVAGAFLAAGCAGPAPQPTSIAGAITQSRPPGGAPSGGGASTGTVGGAGDIGDEANGDMSSSLLNAAIATATGQAGALTVSGTLVAVGASTTVNAHLNRSGASSGTLGFEGASFPFIAANGTDYFQLTPSLMTLMKLTDSSAKGMWVTSASSYGQPLAFVLGRFVSLQGFLSAGMAGSGDDFTYRGTQQLGTRKVVVYQEVSETGQAYEYYFPATGPALVLKVSGGDSTYSEHLDFTWNQPTTPQAPPPASAIYTGAK